MSKLAYANYLPGDFDRYDCLKLSTLIYIAILFVLRGYIIWLVSLSNFNDKVATIELIYPEPTMFYLSLCSGIIGIFIIIIVLMRKPDSANWVKNCWPYVRRLIIFALAIDLCVNIVGFAFLNIGSMVWLFSQTFIAVLLSVCLHLSMRVNINLKEFPEKLPE